MQPVIPSQVRTYPKKFYDKVNKVKWPGYDTCTAFVELSDIFGSVRSSMSFFVCLFSSNLSRALNLFLFNV